MSNSILEAAAVAATYTLGSLETAPISRAARAATAPPTPCPVTLNLRPVEITASLATLKLLEAFLASLFESMSSQQTARFSTDYDNTTNM